MGEGFENIVACFLIKVSRVGGVFSSTPRYRPPRCGFFCALTKRTFDESRDLAGSLRGKWIIFYIREVLDYIIKFISELVPLPNFRLVGSGAY